MVINIFINIPLKYPVTKISIYLDRSTAMSSGSKLNL